jgi:hypothetical protein
MKSRRMALRRRVRARYSQTTLGGGKSHSLRHDKKLLAKKVGWRKAKSGRLYFENRQNRSDKNRRVRL